MAVLVLSARPPQDPGPGARDTGSAPRGRLASTQPRPTWRRGTGVHPARPLLSPGHGDFVSVFENTRFLNVGHSRNFL